MLPRAPPAEQSEDSVPTVDAHVVAGYHAVEEARQDTPEETLRCDTGNDCEHGYEQHEHEGAQGEGHGGWRRRMNC